MTPRQRQIKTTSAFEIFRLQTPPPPPPKHRPLRPRTSMFRIKHRPPTATHSHSRDRTTKRKRIKAQGAEMASRRFPTPYHHFLTCPELRTTSRVQNDVTLPEKQRVNGLVTYMGERHSPTTSIPSVTVGIRTHAYDPNF